MNDRSGQVWEIDYELCTPIVSIVYIVIDSTPETWEGHDGVKHTFFSLYDNEVRSWWEHTTLPFERFSDRRRLA